MSNLKSLISRLMTAFAIEKTIEEECDKKVHQRVRCAGKVGESGRLGMPVTAQPLLRSIKRIVLRLLLCRYLRRYIASPDECN